MRLVLIVGCLILTIMGPGRSARACNGRGGRGGLGIGAAMFSAGVAQMQMMAAQEQYVAAKREEAHRKHVATYTSLRDRDLAKREARRQARLAGHTSNADSTAMTAPLPSK